MYKYIVENNILKARDAIKTVYGPEQVAGSMRNKMASFGAAVLMSGPLSAFAYYYKNEKRLVELIARMYDKSSAEELIQLFESSSPDVNGLIAKSLSLKLALNMFIDPEEDEKKE